MAEPLRVLELLVSTEPGGGPAHVLELASRLPRDEFEVTVAGPGAGVYAERFRAAGASFVEVATDRLSFRAFGTVRRMVSENRIGLVHSHGKGAGLHGRLAARRANIPSLHTFHGIHYSGYPPGVRALYLALERRLAAMSAAVVHVSESQGREAEALGLAPAGKTWVIVNGVDAARLQAQALPREAARAALDLDPATLALGTVARLDPVKALDVLLEAFARLAPRWPAARLVVIGGGSEEGKIRALAARLGIESRVRFLGAIPDAARLLLGLDLYVSASRREGLPLALLEAMALGLPVVTTRVPGHLDAVADAATGLLVAAGQSTALADAAGKLLADPERRRALGEAGRRRVEECFAVERMVAETAALYRAAAGRFPERKSPSSGV